MDDMEKIELVYDPSAAEEYRKEHPEMYKKPVRVEIEGRRIQLVLCVRRMSRTGKSGR